MFVAAGIASLDAEAQSADAAAEAARQGHELVQMSRRVPFASDRRASIERMSSVAAQRLEHLASLVESDPAAVRRLALPSSLRDRLPAAARWSVETHVTKTGSLRRLVTHGENETRVDHFLHAGDGTTHRVYFERAPKGYDGGVVELDGIELPGVGIVADGERDLQYFIPGSTDAPGAVGGTVGDIVNPLGEQKTLVLLVNLLDTADQTPFTISEAHEVVFGTVSDFLMEASYGRTWLTGEVHGWFTLPFDSTCNTIPMEDAADAAAAAAGIDVSSFGRLIYVMKGSAGCSWSGAADMWVYPSRAWLNGNLNPKTIAHELGHGFGLYHSGFLDCGPDIVGTECTASADDKFDTMGGAPAPAHYNAFQKERLGWLEASDVVTVASDGDYRLNPMTLTGGVKALKVPKGTGPDGPTWYYLEFRQPIGFDSFIAGNENVTNGVLVRTALESDGSSSRLLDMTPSSSLSIYADRNDPALVVGQGYSDPDAGITIVTTSASSTGSTVSISLGTTPCVSALPSATATPVQGPWVSPGTPISFTVTLTSHDTEICGPATYDLAASLPPDWQASFTAQSVTLSPGGTEYIGVTVTSSAAATDGHYDISVTATSRDEPASHVSSAVTYVVSSALENNAPVAVDDLGETAVNKDVVIDVTANDADADGDLLFITSVSDGGNGTVHVSGNQVVYSPARRFSGTDQFHYVVSDGLATASATVSITVRKKGGGSSRK